MNDILDDFRRWLGEALATDGAPPPSAPPALDLATLLGHFVALRQEVNLQTRSVRAQQEQTAELVRAVAGSLESLKPAPASRADGDDALKPLLKSLVDVYDALATAGRQVRSARDALVPVLTEASSAQEEEPPSPPPAAPRSVWQRWFGPPAPVVDESRVRQEVERQGRRRHRAEQARLAAERIGQALDGLVAGYTMSLERIDRALRQHGLEPIAAVGRPFDPESMEAMDSVGGTGRPGGEVAEEVRRGYLLGGRVFRYAQVRVARE